MRIIGDSWLHEPMAKILGMRARASRAVGPHKVGAYMPVWQFNYSLYSAAHTQWRRGHGAGVPPKYFQHEKSVCKKHFAQVLQ